MLDLGIEVADFAPKLNLPHDPELMQRLPALPGHFIAVHPGSGGINKSIPLPALFKILGLFARLFPELKILVLAGEADKTLLIDLIKNLPVELKPMVQIIDNIGLLALAEILGRAEIFAGVDSGPAHLAAAVGARTVVIFGPTDPKIWAPPQPWARAVAASYGLRALLRPGAEELRFAQMHGVQSMTGSFSGRWRDWIWFPAERMRKCRTGPAMKAGIKKQKSATVVKRKEILGNGRTRMKSGFRQWGIPRGLAFSADLGRGKSRRP